MLCPFMSVDAWELSNLLADALQSLLWVAFVFHLRDFFQRVSLYFAETLTAGKWKAWEVHPMPARLKCTPHISKPFPN